MDREQAAPNASRFSDFARLVADESPLYSRICCAVAADPELLALVELAPPTQPIPNLLLAAAHDLLLAGADHPLATFYPSVGGRAGPNGVESAFRDFALSNADAISAMVATRRVQTNEVRRCIAWIPAFGLVDGPIAMIEVGASAGLNLLWDRYSYRYDDVRFGDPTTTLELPTEVRGTAPPMPLAMPEVAWRRGIDIHPVDVDDADAVRWVCALLWPEDVERISRFEAAIEIARRHPVVIEEGDALRVLPSLAEQAPDDATLVVYHSFALNQVTAEERDAFANLLDEIRRPVVRLSLEWLDEAEGPMLDLTRHDDGARSTRRLAASHHHGAWIRWST